MAYSQIVRSMGQCQSNFWANNVIKDKRQRRRRTMLLPANMGNCIDTATLASAIKHLVIIQADMAAKQGSTD